MKAERKSRSRTTSSSQSDAVAASKHINPDLLKFVELEGHDEHQLAYVTAIRMREGNYDLTPAITSLDLDTKRIPRFLRLVADTMEGKPSKFDLTVTGKKIVQAWVDVNGVDATGGPLRTLNEVKTRYAISVGQRPPEDPAKIPSWLAGLEGEKKIPDDWTFRKTLDDVHLNYAKDKRGAPRK
jgi:hypothetical protein